MGTQHFVDVWMEPVILRNVLHISAINEIRTKNYLTKPTVRRLDESSIAYVKKIGGESNAITLLETQFY